MNQQTKNNIELFKENRTLLRLGYHVEYLKYLQDKKRKKKKLKTAKESIVQEYLWLKKAYLKSKG